MTSKTRYILLFILAVLFFTAVPYLVLYSLGYRVDIQNTKIVATGGIYVRTDPSASEVIIDNKIHETPSVFSSSVFVQNLLPGVHSVGIRKDGYYDYQKNLSVKEKEVTKLENVILFSNAVLFDEVEDTEQFDVVSKKPLEKFVVRSSNLYYSNAPENAQLTVQQKNTPLIKGIVAFKVSGSDIVWLSSMGSLHKSDQNGQNTEKLSDVLLKIEAGKSYRLELLSQEIFLKAGNSLLLFDRETKSFHPFYDLVKDLKFSPDRQKMIYFNDNEILISSLKDSLKDRGVLVKTTDKITSCFWLNNDYIVFSHGNKISISEIDYRGNVNTVDLPENLMVMTGGTLPTVNPKIFFDPSAKKLYVLVKNRLISSDKILP